jgi:hypothetical protein
MVQGGEGVCLVAEASQMILPLRIVVPDEIRCEHLERDIATQLRIACAIDLAHAARADPFVDRVGANPASTERRGVGDEPRRAARRHWLVEEPG